MAALAVVGFDEHRDGRQAVGQHHLVDRRAAPHRARHLHDHHKALGRRDAPTLGAQVHGLHRRLEHPPVARVPARRQRLRVDVGSQAQGRERHLLDHAAGGIEGLGLQQQVGFDIGTEAIAIAQLVQRFDSDQPAFAPGDAVQRRLGADLVVFGQVGGISQQQPREAIAAAAFEQHRFALGNQALHVFVVAQVFARLAIEDLEALALAGAVDDVHQTRRLDRLALLIHEYAGVVLLARSLLDAREQLDHVIALLGGSGVGGARGVMRGQKSGQKRSGEPAGAVGLPRGSPSQHRPTGRKHKGHQRPAPTSNDTWRTALGPAIWRWASR